MGKYINPFTDWGFKRLFGQEFSKDLLISFLNDLLVDEMHIRDVTFKDKEQLADSKDLRGCIFDIYCETDNGNHFIVKMSFPTIFTSSTYLFLSLTRRQKNVKVILTNGFMC